MICYNENIDATQITWALSYSKRLDVGEESIYSMVRCTFLRFLYNHNFMRIIVPNISYSSQNSQNIGKNKGKYIITQIASTLTAKADTQP